MNKEDKEVTIVIVVFGVLVGVLVDVFMRGQFVLGGEWLVWILPMAMYWLTRDNKKENRNG